MPDRDDPRPSTREVAGEDFLFHLHRGSELLQDNRVHAAKVELDQALMLQPSDPKGQDLLGIVYFRLGLYPRAIAIYERLIQMHPEAVEPRINLALSYLKTGQPAQARFELEKALEQNPKHNRAWGYLGLAFQRMGDYERASQAFSAGGHDVMARRLLDMTGSNAGKYSMQPDMVEQTPLPSGAKGAAPAVVPDTKAEMRRAAGEAVQALDRAGAGFRPDSDLPRIPSGTWSAIEPGRESVPTIPAPPLVRNLVNEDRKAAANSPGASSTLPAVSDPASVSAASPGSTPSLNSGASLGGSASLNRTPSLGSGGSMGSTSRTVPSMPAVRSQPATAASVVSAAGHAMRRLDDAPAPSKRTSALPAQTEAIATARPGTLLPPSSLPPTVAQPPETLVAFARDRLLIFPRDIAIAHHDAGVVLVQATKGFAARIDGLRAVSTAAGTTTQILKRHARGRTFDEPLGGATTPLVEIGGRCELVLSPPPGSKIHAMSLGEEPVYLREDALLGFEMSVSYENGRLPAGDGEAIAMVQLRGRGSVIVALPERAAALEITSSRATSMRALAVLGWMGRLLPRTLPATESPAGMHGFVTFGGEGMVLVDAR